MKEGGIAMRATAVGRKESGAHFETPEQYAGYEVRDPLDQRIGTVERVFLNGGGEPEYIRTRMGFLGKKQVLLPVQMVAVDDERHVLLLR
ncbi:MAG: PRC-barrel domain-containing protein [Rubrobacter sp.]|nr:PRC-barrel domain-containing protein [Rubrobacter sp.]